VPSVTVATGLVVWFAALVLAPAPLAARILLLAPLVIVPRLLSLLPARTGTGRIGGWAAIVAALPLIAAFSFPPGSLAATLTVPWLVLAAIGTVAAIRHGVRGTAAIDP
jgi:hypothetical protein